MLTLADMTDYRATEEQWQLVMNTTLAKSLQLSEPQWACLLELRSRIEEQAARIESVNLEERLQRDFKFLLDRIEALETAARARPLPDGPLDGPSFMRMSTLEAVPSQAAETTTEGLTEQILREQRDLWMQHADLWRDRCERLKIQIAELNRYAQKAASA